jgi:multisubunit Na+/H+ antiporter MnhE subunit
MPAPALAPLTDIFALPTWLPGANVFSIGDVLIGLGIALVIVLAMHRPLPLARSEAVPPADPLTPADAVAGSPGGASAH